MEKDRPDIHRHIHPPILALMFILLAYLIGRFIPAPVWLPGYAPNLGLGLIVIGFLLAAAAFWEFRKARTTLDPHGSVKALVTDGVYQITRNPIYFGFLLMVIGFPLNGGLHSGALVAPFFVVAMNRLVIEKEEMYLEGKFGVEYTEYKSRVGRWW